MTFNRCTPIAAAVAAAALAAGPAAADLIVSFTEDFDSGAANWFDAEGMSVVDWSPGGGPGGGGDAFVTTDFAFTDAGPFGATIFRAQDEFNSSGNAFVGDWIAGGVVEFSFWFRHNVPAPVPVFARFAGPANFPGAAGVSFAPVLPDTWTEVTIPIVPDSPNLVFEGSSFNDVFSNIGHVQIGIDVPDGFENDPTLYAYDLDKVSIVPAPGALLALAGGLMLGRRRRR